MVAHIVQTPGSGEEAPESTPVSMVAHTVTAPSEPAAPEAPAAAAAGDDYKKDAFEAMNKNVAVHDVVAGPEPKKTYKIVMIRHGESEWNKENRFCGWFDAGLSEKGSQKYWVFTFWRLN